MWYKQVKNESEFKKYIDFDPIKRICYHNYFFDEYKFVLKIAFSPPLNNNLLGCYDNMKEIFDVDGVDLKFEKFDFTKYVYLLHYG